MASTAKEKALTLANTWLGLVLAAAIVGAWAWLFIYSVFFFSLSWGSAPLAIIIVAVQVWLYAGMFIVAHDSMHGSLFPKNPRINNNIGQVILIIYAGFHWETMRVHHTQHHDTPGVETDPDFNAANPHGFGAWYTKWFLTYFTWKQLAFLFIVNLLFMFIIKASLGNILLFWAAPALLSSLQLFYFGTYLPHRHIAGGDNGFLDHHYARTNDYSYTASLLSCFHFGYHHEHHLYPHEPWWRLPIRRQETKRTKTYKELVK